MMGISRPIVKHSFLIQSPEEIPEVVKKAFIIAKTGKPGPVVIDVPKDMTDPNHLFDYQYPKEIKMRSYSAPSEEEESNVDEAVSLLEKAKKPVLYAGGGIIQGNATEELKKLAKIMNAPVTNTLMGLGAFPATHENFIGMLGMHGTYEANMAMHEADLIFALGSRFDDRTTNNPQKYSLNAKKYT